MSKTWSKGRLVVSRGVESNGVKEHVGEATGLVNGLVKSPPKLYRQHAMSFPELSKNCGNASPLLVNNVWMNGSSKIIEGLGGKKDMGKKDMGKKDMGVKSFDWGGENLVFPAMLEEETMGDFSDSSGDNMVEDELSSIKKELEKVKADLALERRINDRWNEISMSYYMPLMRHAIDMQILYLGINPFQHYVDTTWTLEMEEAFSEIEIDEAESYARAGMIDMDIMYDIMDMEETESLTSHEFNEDGIWLGGGGARATPENMLKNENKSYNLSLQPDNDDYEEDASSEIPQGMTWGEIASLENGEDKEDGEGMNPWFNGTNTLKNAFKKILPNQVNNKNMWNVFKGYDGYGSSSDDESDDEYNRYNRYDSDDRNERIKDMVYRLSSDSE